MKLIYFFTCLLLASPAYAQECRSLCDPENWSAGELTFLNTAIEAGDDLNALDADGNPTILFAVNKGTEQQLKLLIEAGGDVNIVSQDGVTPLLLAAVHPDSKQYIPILLDAGALITDHEFVDHTILQLLAGSLVSTDMLALVLNAGAGADVNQTNKRGETALHTLALTSTYARQPRLITFNAAILIGVGIDVNIQNTRGWTALHRTVSGRSTILAMILLNAGADATLVNEDGQTAFDLAVNNDAFVGSDVWEMLRDANR